MLIVRCPACQTTFRATPEHLGARSGRVRCGHCYTPFNALEHLVESAPAQAPDEQAPSAVPAQVPTEPVVANDWQEDPKQNSDVSETGSPRTEAVEETTSDLDERLARALSPSDGIDLHAGRGEHRPDYEDDFDLHEALTEPPDIDEAEDRHTDESHPERAVFKPAAPGDPDAFSSLRWSPVQRPGGVAPANQSKPVWPILVAQPAEPETIQPGVFPKGTGSTSYDTSPGEDERNDTSWSDHPPEEHVDSLRPIAADPDDQPGRATVERRSEPGLNRHESAPPLIIDEDDTPDFSHYGKGKPRGRVWLWAVLVGVLLGSLAVQSLYVFRVELARQWPQVRPVFVELCDRFGCEMPLPRNPQAINVTASNLESDPNAPTSFILHARLRNDATYVQAHPHLELTLTDARDRPVARRVLEPGEWLTEEAVGAGFASRAELDISLPFSAPELTNATGYRLYAFYP